MIKKEVFSFYPKMFVFIVLLNKLKSTVKCTSQNYRYLGKIVERNKLSITIRNSNIEILIHDNAIKHCKCEKRTASITIQIPK